MTDEDGTQVAPTDTEATTEPWAWRWQHAIAAVTAIATVALVVVAVLPNDEGGARPTGESTPVTAARPTSTTTPGQAPSSTLAGGAARLGRELEPWASESCHGPGFANGSAWTLRAVDVGGQPVPDAYVCHLFAASEGSIEFVVGRAFSTLNITIGFADESSSVTHQARFEVIGDDTSLLVEPKTLRIGEREELAVDVSNTSRLKLKVTEVSPRTGNDASSLPVWGNGVLTPRP